MDRVGPFNTGTLAETFGTTAFGTWQNANPGGGIEGSVPSIRAWKDVIEEVVYCIEQSGQTPSNANLHQLWQALTPNRLPFGTAGGTANAITTTLDSVPAAWTDLRYFNVLLTLDNTAAAPTVAPNGLAARTVKLPDGTTNAPIGALQAGMVAHFFNDGTNVRLFSIEPASVADAEAGTRGEAFISPATLFQKRNPYFIVSDAGGTTTIPNNTVTKLTHLTSINGSFFTDGGSTFASSAFTCGTKDAGSWMFLGYFGMPMTAGGTIRNYLALNTTTGPFQSIKHDTGTLTHGLVNMRVIQLAATNVVDMRAFQTSGVSTTAEAAQFIGFRLGG